ncbi:MAG: hemolysin [Bacteroidetes bacterium HGW-Bacteroidetes-17]|nr:MAG: hemolysin [Bacteroidetes bacterium HGW-Bacteroidetes-17]
METIMPPVNKASLEKELNDEIFIRNTNFGNNEIYVFTAHDSPNLMQEVGRLREITFRDAKGGTGKSIDIDSFDTSEIPFKQLIVWNPEDKEIIGGYRFIHCKNLQINEKGVVSTPTAELFKYSEKFVKEFLPCTIELGRSFVQPLYQPSNNIRKGMYSLDNIWDGLGSIMVDNPDVKYLFGKVTMYPHFNVYARDIILFFMEKYFPDKDELVRPHKPMNYTTDADELNRVFTSRSYDEDYKILVQKVRSLGENIPPLFNAYMNLSSTMRTFGTALNDHFGLVEETGIMVTVDDIFEVKKDRHVTTYKI